jgi:flagellar hook-associated protein 2
VSTISSSSSATSSASAATAAQTAAAQAQLDLQEVGQSLISASTGNTTIDPTTLVSDLVTAKVAGQTAALETQAANDETQISAIGQLSAALSQLQVDLGPLSSGQLMSTYTASVSGTGVTATAGTGAAPASYSLYVGQVAQAQSLTSGAISAATASSMGTGALTISVGTQSMTLNIANGSNSLSSIVSAINSSTSNPGISASIVTGSDGSHLVLASTLTGAGNTINVSVASGATGEIANLGVQSVSTNSGVSTLATTISGDNDFLSAAVPAADAAGTSSNAAAGTLTISVGSGSMSITPTSTNESLSALATQINAASGNGSNPTVNATVVTDGNGNQYLQITSPSSSSTAPVTVSASSGSTGLVADVGTQYAVDPNYNSATVSYADAAGTSNNAAGTLTIAVGKSSMSITPTSASESLSALAAQINAASGTGTNPTVTATVVTDASGNQSLQITSPNSSASTPVTVSANSGATGLIADVATQAQTSASPDVSDYGASDILTTGSSNIGWTQTSAAQNAYFTINGTQATSALNTVQSALSGVTLSLSSTAVGTTQTLTVAPDTTTMANDIGQFVSDYNSLVSTIGTLTQFDSSSPSSSGPLIGDPMIQQIDSSFGTIIGSMVKGSGTTATLSDLGITLNDDGTLTLDSTTLDNALQNNSSQVAAVFNSTNGIGQQLNKQINSFTDTGGTISVRDTQLSTDLQSITTQTDQINSYSAQLTSMYQDEFTNLNNVMSTTYTESEYLTDLFGGSEGGGALNKSS